jgi:uncharacterized protein (TIGR04255 family)
MAFPESTRVVYARNPLESVICQLRFPPILRIDTEAPAAFQDRIRDSYPLLTQRSAFDLRAALPPEIANVILADVPVALQGSGTAYDFSSPDEAWKVTLARNFLAVTTMAYTRWEEFRRRLTVAVETLSAIYRPAFCTRTGLRYRNVIRRSGWGLDQYRWAELLMPHLVGPLSAPAVGDAVLQLAGDVVIDLAEPGRVRMQHGLLPGKTPADTAYYVDADFSTDERLEVDRAIERLDYFNRQAGRLFRWCIRDRLHDAMGPTAI